MAKEQPRASGRAHLIEPGEGVVLALLRSTAPVEEHGSVLAGWVRERHPFPRPHLLGAQLGLHSAVTLACITGQQWRCIPNSRVGVGKSESGW